jgi:hypothetical protein
MNAQEASGQNATVKKRAQLALDKPGDQTAALPLPGQEGLEMAGHNAVEDALFRPAYGKSPRSYCLPLSKAAAAYRRIIRFAQLPAARGATI